MRLDTLIEQRKKSSEEKASEITSLKGQINVIKQKLDTKLNQSSQLNVL